MIKLIKKILIGIIITLVLCAVGCSINPPVTTEITISEDAPNEILINEFDFENYNIVIHYSNKKSKEIPLTEEMLDPIEYLNAIKKEGEHTITITYEGFSCKYTFTVKKYEFTDVYIENQTIVYDGQYHSLEVKGNIPLNTKIEFVDKNLYKNANEYIVTARLVNEGYLTKTITGKLIIEHADYDLSKIKFESAEFTYDGNEKSIAVTGLEAGVEVSYKIGNDNTNKRVNAGTYEITACFAASANYNKIPDMKATLTINKATYDMSAYQMVDKSVYYTGEISQMHVTNEQSLPYGVTVTYVGLAEAINAGEYTIIARFKGDSNYNEIDDISAKLTIKPAVVGLTGVYLDSKSVVYDKKEHSIEYSGTKPNSINLNGYTIYNQQGDKVYDSSSLELKYKKKPVDVGTYVVYAHFSYRDNKNYADIEPLSAVLIITKADITDIVIENESKEYVPGMGQSLTVKTGMQGIIATPNIANPVDPGDYLITYTFSLTPEVAKNYNVPEPITRTLSITKKNVFSGNVSQSKYYATYDGTLHTIDVNISDEEAEWIEPYFFYYNEQQEETQFVGFSEPGTYLIFVKFTVNDLAPENYSNYYYIPSRSSAYLVINKKKIEFDETWLENRMVEYDGTTVTVTIDDSNVNEKTGKTGLQSFLDTNLGLVDGDYTITYKNNYATDADYYTGSLDVVVTGEKANYFDNLYNFEFHYAIKKGNGEEVYPSVLQKTFDYDGKEHGIILSDLPDGISVKYEGDVNSLVMPGQKDIIILFHCENDVAKWYYSFPDLAVSTMGGDPQLFLQLTVSHIDYVPELDTPTYYYELGSESRGISVKKPVFGVDVTFEYDDEERVNVGTYGVTAHVTVTSEELLKIYNSTYSFRAQFSIIPTDYKFSFAGMSAVYDGNKHNIMVMGIDEEVELGYITYSIEDKDGNPIDGYTDVGVYNIYIKFTNYSQNYKNIPNQSLQLSIETSKVDTQSIVDYVNNTVYARVNQMETVYSFFNSIFDTTPFDITYKIDYYLSAENAQYPQDPLFHGQGTTEDFTFTQFTSDSGFALLELNLVIKKGYESKDKSFTSSYHGFIRIKIMPINKYDISSATNALRKNHTIEQGSTLEDEYFSVLSGLDYLYTCEYLNGEEEYDDRYLYKYGTSEDENKFDFKYNTFENRKVKVTLTIPVTDNYLFYDGIHSVTEINEVFYLDVTINDTIDIYYVTDAISNLTEMDQYTNFENKIKSYYDTSLYTIYYRIKDSDGKEVANTDNLGFMSTDGTYTLCVTITGKNLWKILNNGQNSFDLQHELTVNTVLSIQIQDFLDSLDEINTSIGQYDSVCKQIADELVIPEGLKVEYHLVDNVGVIKDGILNDLYHYKGNIAIEDALVFYDFDNSIPDDNKILLTLTLRPQESGYILVDGGYNIIGDELELPTKTFTVFPRTKVEYYYVYAFTWDEIKAHDNKAKQYTSLLDYFGWIKRSNDHRTAYENGLINYDITITYTHNGESTVLVDKWEDFDTLVPVYDSCENDKITYSIRMYSDRDDVCISANPNLDRFDRTMVFSTGVEKTELDETLSSRLDNLTANNKVSEIKQYTNLSDFVKTNVLSYISTGGPTIDNYTLQLVDSTTYAVDANFVKVTKTLNDVYALNTKNAEGKVYKVTVNFNNSSATKFVLSDDGMYKANAQRSFYITVIDNEYTFDVSQVNSYTVPTYTQFNAIADTVKSISISDKLKIKSWKLLVPYYYSTTAGDTFSGNLSSTATITKQYNNLSDYKNNGLLTVTYELTDSDYTLIKNNVALDVTTFTYTYDFTINYLKQVNLSALYDFGNSDNQFYLVGAKPRYYSGQLLGDVEGITYEHVKNIYEDNEFESEMGDDDEITSDIYSLNIWLKITCKNGYYVTVENGNPKTVLDVQIRKLVKEPIWKDTSYLKALEYLPTKIQNTSITIKPQFYYTDDVIITFRYRNCGESTFTEYNKVPDGGFVFTKSTTPGMFSYGQLTWDIKFNGSSNQALGFADVGNWIGYTGSYPEDSYGSIYISFK